MSIKLYTKQESDKLIAELKANEALCYPSIISSFGSIMGPGHLIVIGATTGSGKTHIALAEALNAIRHHHKVLYIHNEMTDAQLLMQCGNYGYNDDEISNCIAFDETSEYLGIEQDILQACDIGFDTIIIDHLDAANITDEQGRQGYEVLQRFLMMIDDIRKHHTNLCFIILSQLNGRYNGNVSIEQLISTLDFANCHGLPNKADFSYVFCKNEVTSSTWTNYCDIRVQVRKDRYNVSKSRDFSISFDYKLGKVCK